jgi:hypothetical protein
MDRGSVTLVLVYEEEGRECVGEGRSVDVSGRVHACIDERGSVEHCGEEHDVGIRLCGARVEVHEFWVRQWNRLGHFLFSCVSEMPSEEHVATESFRVTTGLSLKMLSFLDAFLVTAVAFELLRLYHVSLAKLRRLIIGSSWPCCLSRSDARIVLICRRKYHAIAMRTEKRRMDKAIAALRSVCISGSSEESLEPLYRVKSGMLRGIAEKVAFRRCVVEVERFWKFDMLNRKAWVVCTREHVRWGGVADGILTFPDGLACADYGL